MKYFVLLPDGGADYPIPELGSRTVFETAKMPAINELARTSLAGMVSNVPDGMVPESDTANLAVLSYDPKVYSKGRSPLEAVSMGIDMKPDETAFRCNVVTLGGEGDYESLTMVDHSSDEITTAEADQLIRSVDEALGGNGLAFHTGVSYRHCLIWKNAPDFKDFMRPHDILGKGVASYLPPEPFLTLQKKSYEILKDHPVNRARVARGLRPANSIWLWSPGKKPALPSFADKWGVKGAVISAVDLIKGIGLCAGMASIDVEGATGNVHTNYDGKAQAAIEAFRSGFDYVYVHVEGPDECGHRAEIDNKVLSMELIDGKILRPVLDYLRGTGEEFRVLVLPDHPTPIAIRTHASDPVPFILYDSARPKAGVPAFTEKECAKTGLYLEHGYELMDRMIGGRDM